MIPKDLGLSLSFVPPIIPHLSSIYSKSDEIETLEQAIENGQKLVDKYKKMCGDLIKKLTEVLIKLIMSFTQSFLKANYSNISKVSLLRVTFEELICEIYHRESASKITILGWLRKNKFLPKG